jgi:hypothetical protein
MRFPAKPLSAFVLVVLGESGNYLQKIVLGLQSDPLQVPISESPTLPMKQRRSSVFSVHVFTGAPSRGSGPHKEAPESPNLRIESAHLRISATMHPWRNIGPWQLWPNMLSPVLSILISGMLTHPQCKCTFPHDFRPNDDPEAFSTFIVLAAGEFVDAAVYGIRDDGSRHGSD